MVNPFVAESLVLFTFIEIMETICEKAFTWESFQVEWLLKFLSISEATLIEIGVEYKCKWSEIDKYRRGCKHNVSSKFFFLLA